jgi:hypothetical protein
MTKKELIESEWLKKIPDDAEIVFRTNEKANMCHKLKLEHLSIWRQCVNVEEIPDGHGFYKFRNPQYMTAVVIEGMPCGALDYYRKDAIADTKAKAVEVLKQVMEKYESSKQNINVIVNAFEEEIKKESDDEKDNV